MIKGEVSRMYKKDFLRLINKLDIISNKLNNRYLINYRLIANQDQPLHLFVSLSRIAFVEIIAPYLKLNNRKIL